MCMSVLFDEQGNLLIERSAENVVPTSEIDEIILHHESFELEKMQTFFSLIGAEVLSEGYHV